MSGVGERRRSYVWRIGQVLTSSAWHKRHHSSRCRCVSGAAFDELRSGCAARGVSMLKRSVDTDRKRRRFSRCATALVRIAGGGHRGIVGDRVQRTYLRGLLHGEDALVVMANTLATTLSAVALVMNARVAKLDASSVLFMAIPPRGAMVHRAVFGCGSGCRVARRRATAVRKNAVVSGGAGRYGVASRQSTSTPLPERDLAHDGLEAA